MNNAGPSPRGDFQRTDFLVWAMGTRRRAAAVVILPVLAGLLLGILATLLHFGMRYPTYMWLIPWDLSAHYECFVLPRNVARGCLLLAPLAAAVILWTQSHFRLSTKGDPASAPVNGPPIDLPYWPIAAIGVLLAIIVPSAFDLFGAGWYFACRIEDLYGIGGRFALTAMIALVAPATSIAALTIAYGIRKRVALAALPKAAEHALRSVGYTLIVAGLLCLRNAAWIVRREDPESAVLTGVMNLTAGVLIVHGSLGAARLMGWLSAAAIAVAAGQAISAPLRIPLGLLDAKLHVEPTATIFAIALFLASFALSLWIYLAVRAPAILNARKAVGRTAVLPWTGFAFGALMAGSGILGLVMLQTGDLTTEAERRARAKYGANYSYLVTSIGIGSHDNHVYASVVGYNAQAIIDAKVDWNP